MSQRVGVISEDIARENVIWSCNSAISQLKSALASAEKINNETAAEEIRAAIRHVQLAQQAVR